jgi:hypothetical protein
MPLQQPGDRSVRTVDEVKGVARGPAGSLWRTAKERAAVAEPPRAPVELAPAAPGPRTIRDKMAFLRHAIVQWAKEYLAHIFQRRRPLPPYAPGHTGVYRLPNTVCVALASDWGTGTRSAYRVAEQIVKASPDVTIHLGDVYYSGTEDEYRTYFMAPGCWPHGKLVPAKDGDASGTWVLNANHEMYSGGRGYFDLALPQLRQETSYFCLENEHWRIVAVDTGYHCTRGIKKLLPFLFGDKTRLDDATVAWLAAVFARATDQRPVILLSHHQWFSAFDDRDYPKVGEQLEPYLGRVALWFWGHEHRLAGYAPFGRGRSQVRARCIGHGGMPIEIGWKRKAKDPHPAVFSDQRVAGSAADGTKLGFCGFARLDFRDAQLMVTYVDENGKALLEETWTRKDVRLTGSVRLLEASSEFELYLPIEDLVK